VGSHHDTSRADKDRVGDEGAKDADAEAGRKRQAAIQHPASWPHLGHLPVGGRRKPRGSFQRTWAVQPGMPCGLPPTRPSNAEIVEAPGFCNPFMDPGNYLQWRTGASHLPPVLALE